MHGRAIVWPSGPAIGKVRPVYWANTYFSDRWQFSTEHAHGAAPLRLLEHAHEVESKAASNPGLCRPRDGMGKDEKVRILHSKRYNYGHTVTGPLTSSPRDRYLYSVSITARPDQRVWHGGRRGHV